MNILLFYIFSILLSLWFVEPVWYFYWSKFATFTLIGLMFSVLTIVWILFEVPTGMFADKFGRKLSITIGAVSLAAGCWFLAAATNVWWLFFGGLFQNIGRAFISGALEALVYDDLKFRGKEGVFDKILARKMQLSILGFAMAVVIGGFLYNIHFRIPHLLMAITATIAFVTSIFLRDTYKITGHHKSKLLTLSLAGFKQLADKKLRPFVYPAVFVLSLYFLFDWGMSKPAIAVNSGFFAKEQGIIYALLALINVYIVGKLPRLRRILGDRRGLLTILLVMGIGYLLGSLKLGLIGLISLFLLSSASELSDSWISAVVNSYIESRYRATTLSTLQFVGRLPFNLFGIVSGVMIDRGLINNFHATVGISAILAAVAYGINKRQDVPNSINSK